jgi:hypothetical protein
MVSGGGALELPPEADASGRRPRQIGPIRMGQFWGRGLKFGLKYGIICGVLHVVCKDKIETNEEDNFCRCGGACVE